MQLNYFVIEKSAIKNITLSVVMTTTTMMIIMKKREEKKENTTVKKRSYSGTFQVRKRKYRAHLLHNSSDIVFSESMIG